MIQTVRLPGLPELRGLLQASTMNRRAAFLLIGDLGSFANSGDLPIPVISPRG
jgi:hypothetical protein